jgi:hypothetical protein
MRIIYIMYEQMACSRAPATMDDAEQNAKKPSAVPCRVGRAHNAPRSGDVELRKSSRELGENLTTSRW